MRLDAPGQAWKVYIKDCVVCERVFATPHWGLPTCSDDCKKVKLRDYRRETEHRRRARKRDAFVAPVYRRKVHERDGWRCHICRKKVRQNAVVPHPLAPTLDHVIPLAKGGTHEPANVRTAHFMCNALKSDGGGNEQLLLIG